MSNASKYKVYAIISEVENGPFFLPIKASVSPYGGAGFNQDLPCCFGGTVQDGEGLVIPPARVQEGHKIHTLASETDEESQNKVAPNKIAHLPAPILNIASITNPYQFYNLIGFPTEGANFEKTDVGGVERCDLELLPSGAQPSDKDWRPYYENKCILRITPDVFFGEAPKTVGTIMQRCKPLGLMVECPPDDYTKSNTYQALQIFLNTLH